LEDGDMKQQKGYTLIELMMVVAIIGIVGSMIVTFFLQVYKSYTLVESKAKVVQIAMSSLGSIQKQLREVSQVPTITANATLHPTAGAPVSFYIPSLTDPTNRSADDIVEYYLNPYNGKNIMVQRLRRGLNAYTPISTIYDFDNYRANPGVVPKGGGLVNFLDDKTLWFDDVAFYYDDIYNMINVGITVSVKNKGTTNTRESITITTAIAIRNTF
jgi:prepilin-type N-terminal cleavage/methylation domain-containing protein